MTQAKHAIAATSGCGIGILLSRKPTPSCDKVGTDYRAVHGATILFPQHRAYMKQVEDARAACADETSISFVTSWHRHPLLIAAIVEHIQRTGTRFRRRA